MGFLNNSVVTVDAVLTKKGRELLARNDGSFQITQFSVADDDVDYTMYNPSHPSGSAFFGEAIESQPLMEALVDENQMLKYKLITLPRGTSKLPVVSAGYASVRLQQGASVVITPETLNYLGSTRVYESSGYTVTVGDARLLATFTGAGIDTTNLGLSNLSTTTGAQLSKTQIGTSFTLIATTINTLFGTSASSLTTTITIVGRDSGARITIPLTVVKTS